MRLLRAEALTGPTIMRNEEARRNLVQYLRGYARGIAGAQLDTPTRVRFVRRVTHGGLTAIAVQVTIR